MKQFMVQVDGLERAKAVAMWGTFGKDGVAHCFGRCPEHTLRFVRLIDCSTEHLKAILDTQSQISPDYRMIIRSILKDRKLVSV